MMDERLAKRIVLARRKLRIADGAANEEDLRLEAEEKQLEEFRGAVDTLLNVTVSYLLGVEFARDAAGPVARLEAEGVRFELRPNGNRDLELRESNNQRPVKVIVGGNRLAGYRILCAIADHLDGTEPSSESKTA
jgi:hypothetical protein